MNSADPIHFVDGVSTSAIPVDDRGLQFGDGFFETFWLLGDKIPNKSSHLERILETSDRLMIDVSVHLIEQALTEVVRVAEQQSGIIKLIITRGSSVRGYSPNSNRGRVILSFYPQSAPAEPAVIEPLHICVSTVQLARQPLLAGIKHLNRLENVLAAAEMNKSANKQALLLDTHDNVIECVSANLFFLNKDKLLTPDLSFCGVNGVSRKIILEKLAPSIGLSVEQGDYTLENVLQADEVFCSNSIQGIVPITTINNISLNNTAATKKLIGHWWKHFYEAAEPAI